VVSSSLARRPASMADKVIRERRARRGAAGRGLPGRARVPLIDAIRRRKCAESV